MIECVRELRGNGEEEAVMVEDDGGGGYGGCGGGSGGSECRVEKGVGTLWVL